MTSLNDFISSPSQSASKRMAKKRQASLQLIHLAALLFDATFLSEASPESKTTAKKTLRISPG